MTPNVELHELIYLSKQYKPVAVVYMKNGCCPDKPVIVVKTKNGVVSAQCACGMWCTNGHRTATVAVKEYERMSNGRGIWNSPKDRVQTLEDMICDLNSRG